MGASGAVLGVLVAFVMAYPDRQMFLFPIPYPVSGRGMILLLIMINVVYGLLGSNMSVLTHFGGMGAGFLYMRYVPRWRSWVGRRKRGARGENRDPLGEAVDNIFQFEKEKRRRKM